MFKLLILLLLQGAVLGWNSWAVIGAVIGLAVPFALLFRRFRRAFVLGASFFVSFLVLLIGLQIIEWRFMHGLFEVRPLLTVVGRGFASFLLLATFSQVMTRLEFLSALHRVRVPGYAISVIYFTSYFLARLSRHAQGLRRFYQIKATHCHWWEKVTLLFSASRNLMIFAFVRSRDIPKVMELRGLTGSLPIEDWRHRESAY